MRWPNKVCVCACDGYRNCAFKDKKPRCSSCACDLFRFSRINYVHLFKYVRACFVYTFCSASNAYGVFSAHTLTHLECNGTQCTNASASDAPNVPENPPPCCYQLNCVVKYNIKNVFEIFRLWAQTNNRSEPADWRKRANERESERIHRECNGRLRHSLSIHNIRILHSCVIMYRIDSYKLDRMCVCVCVI